MTKNYVSTISLTVFLALVASTSSADCSGKAPWQHEHTAPTDTTKTTTVTASEGSTIVVCRSNYPIGKKPRVTVKFDSGSVSLEEFKCETRASEQAVIRSRASRSGPNQPTIVKGTSQVCM